MSEVESTQGPISPKHEAMGLVRWFLSATWQLIWHPATYFSAHGSETATEGGLSAALAYAIVVQWLAAFFNFIWQAATGSLIRERLADFFRIAQDLAETQSGYPPGIFSRWDGLRQQVLDVFFGAGTVLLAPFGTLLHLVFSAAIIHVAVRLFFKDEPGRNHSYSTTLKILCFASAPWILCIIPGFGMVLGWVLSVSAATIGLREVYRSTTGRALLAVMFPDLLVMTFIMMIGMFFLLIAMNVFRLIF